MIIVTAVDEDDGYEVYAFHCASETIADLLEGMLIVSGLNVTVQRPFVRAVASEDEIDQAVGHMVATARRMTGIEETRASVESRLPSGWRLSGPAPDPEMRRWEVVATGPTPSRLSRKRADSIIGVGSDEIAALRDLAAQLTTGD